MVVQILCVERQILCLQLESLLGQDLGKEHCFVSYDSYGKKTKSEVVHFEQS